jgi:uncharacterized protein (TIGR02246 family)
MRKWRIFGVVATVAVGLIVGIEKMPAQQGDPKTKSLEGTGKGKRAQDFIAAFNKGDAKAVAAFWTPDGDYVDEVGHAYKGRAALEKLYEKIFAAQKGSKLTVYITGARMVGTDVAIEDGITEVAPADGGPPSSAQFTAVLVKKDGQWYFESVRDSVAYPPSNAEHFADLEWLIGSWAGPEKGESATATYSWAENQNFIVSTFATTLNGVPVVGGTQWIVWDAVDKRIRSWSFYSGGGFGEGVWSRDGKNWNIAVTAKMANGKKASGTNVLTKVDDNNAIWQVTKLTVDGTVLPDAPPVKLKRVMRK